MALTDVFLLLGGLGLFLYGMTIMSDSLRLVAGDNMRNVLEKTTKNKFLGVIMGMVVTFLIQSSSATTVMTVSFVSAGLMNLSQALGVIMGANIGTTITAQIIAFNLGSYAPIIVFVGAAIALFAKNKTVKNSGLIILGFGMLFVGISMMSDAVYPLRDSEVFRKIITELKNPIIAILVGLVFSVIIQSSSASVGITQAFAAAGLVELHVAIYLIMGMAIGTCITPIIASLTASRDGKRTAFMSLFFNIVRVVIFAAIVGIFPSVISFFEKLSPGDVSRQIANSHMISSIVAVIIELPFSALIVKLSYIVIPVTPEEKNKVEKKLIYLTKGVELSPSIAITQAKRETCRMGEIARDNLALALDSFFKKDDKPTEVVFDTEKTINYLNHEITACLVTFRALELSRKDLNTLGMMFRVVSDIERIGDHAENIAEYTVLENVKSANISDIAMGEIKEIAEASLKVVDLALAVYRDESHDLLDKVSELEEHVDDLHEKFTDNHVARLMQDKCDPLGGVVFTDILTDLERISDHAINIAYSIVEEKPHVLKVYS